MTILLLAALGLEITCTLDPDSAFRVWSEPPGLRAGYFWRGTEAGSPYDCLESARTGRGGVTVAEYSCEHPDIADSFVLRLPETAVSGELGGIFEISVQASPDQPEQRYALCRIGGES